MPQMTPLNWILLMLFFIMILFMLNIFIYFNFIKMNSSLKLNLKKKITENGNKPIFKFWPIFNCIFYKLNKMIFSNTFYS